MKFHWNQKWSIEKSFAKYHELMFKFWMKLAQHLYIFPRNGQKLTKFIKYWCNFPSHFATFNINLVNLYRINQKIVTFYKISQIYQYLTKFHRMTWYNSLISYNFDVFYSFWFHFRCHQKFTTKFQFHLDVFKNFEI